MVQWRLKPRLTSLCIHAVSQEPSLFVYNNEPRHKKTCLRGLQPGMTHLACPASEDSQSLKILDLASI